MKPDEEPRSEGWLDGLGDDDLAFLKRFVLASGSLKDTAAAYDVSYPTIRLRLDRLIEKIKVWDSKEPMSELERVVRAEHADGKIDLETLKRILAAYRQEGRRA